jgi:hypothetical protein
MLPLQTPRLAMCPSSKCGNLFCHQFSNNSQSVFPGFTHHDISVRWWSKYIFYAYWSTNSPDMIHKFYILAIHDIQGPKLQSNVTLSSITLADPEIILPAIQRIKNYPKNAICFSELSNTPLTQSRVHLSQTNSEEMEDDILNKLTG